MPDERPTKTGVIKLFLPHEGYGFIVPDDGGSDVFFHLTQCHIPRSIKLLTGTMRVRFRPTELGSRADDVWLADEVAICPCCGRKNA